MERFCKIAAAILIVSLFISAAALAQVDRTTLTNKVMVGYQGWHMCPGDGNDPSIGWNHWSESNTTIGPGYYHTEIWPDVTEYSGSDLFSVPNTTLTYGGTPYLYSDVHQGSTNTHWRWMMENGIDGAFVQRFLCRCVGNPNDPLQHMTDTVLQHELNAANTYGRVICLEYDISGVTDANLYSQLTTDWQYLKSTFNLTNNSRYLYHNGKPVVIIWGLGYSDRPGDPTTATNIANYFKNDGEFVMVGVPGAWRTQGVPCKTDPAWLPAWRTFNGITPWSVGGYVDWNGINSWKNTYVTGDLSDCNSRGIFYMTTAWPRFGWDNMNHTTCGSSHISSRGGQHLWDQMYAWKSAGVQAQFIAMMDEYDESTAIMKLTDNVPTGACWWSTEGKGNDWWLRLANQGSRMQKGQIALSQTIPISSSTSPDNATFVSDTIPTTMNLNQQYNVAVTMKNTGETTWSWENFKLGGVGDTDPFASTRQGMTTGTSIAPNSQYTFNFTMTAPSTAGTYTTDWQMVHDPVRWFGAIDTKVVTVGGGGGQTPYAGVIALPGTIQAENYDNGGEGIAYHDDSSGNAGGQYRTDNVDIAACSDTGGGYTVGWIDTGEWLEYTVSNATAGDYDFYVRVSSPNTGSSFKILIDGTDVSGTRTFESTGSWDTWTTIIVPARHLNAGQHVLQFNVVTGGFNLNKIDVYNRNADAISVDLGNPDNVDGLSLVTGIGDGDTVPWTAAGHDCRENINTGDLYMYFAVNDAWALNGNKQNVYITFDYYDLGTGTLGLNYDAVGNQWAYVAGPALTNTGGWKQYTFHVTNAYFGNRENGGADFRICGVAAEWGLDTVCVYQ